MSAVFVRARGDVRILGVTEQLIGEAWLNAPPFRYAGNVGPVEPAPELRLDLLRIGLVLGEQCGLLGLFGVDFVLHDGRPWVVEVNPRYPASVEVLELATGVLALPLHRMAFDPEADPERRIATGWPVIGKAVLYAPHRLAMPPYDPTRVLSSALRDDLRVARQGSGVHLADIPATGEVIERGWPVLTILAEAESRERCLTELKKRAERVGRLLFDDPCRAASDRIWYASLDDPDDE
jgi:predicted ATP-grasp superfamily ATP-dependent carboligase